MSLYTGYELVKKYKANYIIKSDIILSTYEKHQSTLFSRLRAGFFYSACGFGPYRACVWAIVCEILVYV